MKQINDWLIDIAEVIDAYRIVPRLFMVGYAYLVWDMYEWFIHLTAPTSAQSAFVSVIIGVAGVITGVYFKSGLDWKEYRKMRLEEDNK